MLGGYRAPKQTWAERQVAQEIVSELGGHALALDVTGAMLRFEPYAELLARLRNPGDDELELAAGLKEELPTGHERSISATLAPA